jgi:hypothetical protein
LWTISISQIAVSYWSAQRVVARPCGCHLLNGYKRIFRPKARCWRRQKPLPRARRKGAPAPPHSPGSPMWLRWCRSSQEALFQLPGYALVRKSLPSSRTDGYAAWPASKFKAVRRDPSCTATKKHITRETRQKHQMTQGYQPKHPRRRPWPRPRRSPRCRRPRRCRPPRRFRPPAGIS